MAEEGATVNSGHYCKLHLYVIAETEVKSNRGLALP